MFYTNDSVYNDLLNASRGTLVWTEKPDQKMASVTWFDSTKQAIWSSALSTLSNNAAT